MKTKPGDVVAYLAFGGQRRIAKVTGSFEDVKNGRPGFDGELTPESPDYEPSGQWNSVWGYDSQIIAINKEACP